jgi:transketolase
LSEAIIARTVKGKGVAAVEDIGGWDGKALPEEEAKKAIAELGGERHITIEIEKPEPPAKPTSFVKLQPLQLPTYKVVDAIGTRTAKHSEHWEQPDRM